MRAKPIKTGFFTHGGGAIRPNAPKDGKRADAENPIKTRFFTCGTCGKNQSAASGGGSLGTRPPFREACRNCHNPPAQPCGKKLSFQRVAEATNNPRLFRDTYWGNFRLALNADTITAEHIQNRDAFAKRWRLRRLLGSVGLYPSTGTGEDFDHPETYKDAEGWVVLVVSNYRGPPPSVLGLVRIAPIYGLGVVSYAGRFASQRELRARLDACGGERKPFAVRGRATR